MKRLELPESMVCYAIKSRNRKLRSDSSFLLHDNSIEVLCLPFFHRPARASLNYLSISGTRQLFALIESFLRQVPLKNCLRPNNIDSTILFHGTLWSWLQLFTWSSPCSLWRNCTRQLGGQTRNNSRPLIYGKRETNTWNVLCNNSYIFSIRNNT